MRPQTARHRRASWRQRWREHNHAGVKPFHFILQALPWRPQHCSGATVRSPMTTMLIWFFSLPCGRATERGSSANRPALYCCDWRRRRSRAGRARHFCLVSRWEKVEDTAELRRRRATSGGRTRRSFIARGGNPVSPQNPKTPAPPITHRSLRSALCRRATSVGGGRGVRVYGASSAAGLCCLARAMPGCGQLGTEPEEVRQRMPT